MRFAICGGDLRSVYLVQRLRKDGHTVHCFDLELGDLPPSCHTASLHTAVCTAQCIILPTPVYKGGMLNAPLGSCVVTPEELAQTLPPHVPIFGGSIPEDFLQLCSRRGVYPVDLLSLEAVAVKNAALTAECAVQVILREIPYTLNGCPILILGAGRIGRLLGLKLRALGAAVTAAARKDADRAWCAALGLTPVDFPELASVLPQVRLLINTIPAQVLSQAQLSLLPQDALLFELASKPGGFPSTDLHTVIGCGGLPGTYAPQSAADIIADTIYHRLEV